MRRMSVLNLALAAAVSTVALFGVVGPGAVAVPGYEPDDWKNVRGNWCEKIGAEYVVKNKRDTTSGCVDVRSRSKREIIFRAGAVNITKDGDGAYTGGLFEQLVDGRWRKTRPVGGFIFGGESGEKLTKVGFFMFTNKGSGTSAKIGRIDFRKMAGASEYRIRFEVCAAVPDEFEPDEPGLDFCRVKVAGPFDW